MLPLPLAGTMWGRTLPRLTFMVYSATMGLLSALGTARPDLFLGERALSTGKSLHVNLFV
jgi:hypothetical protein